MEPDSELLDGSIVAIFCEVASDEPGDEQLHTGFVFKDDDGLMQIVDLQWHYRFMKRSLPLNLIFAYSIPDNWTDINQRIIRAKLTRLARLHENKLPYSVAGFGLKFADGDWLGAAEGDGLTCATFVTEFLQSLGLPIVDLQDWHIRPDDEIWMIKITGWLRDALLKRGLPTKHVDLQVEKIKKSQVVRVRPADILVAADRTPPPWGLRDIEMDSDTFHRKILKSLTTTRTTQLMSASD